MNIDLTKGQPLVIQRSLPFKQKPTETVFLDLGIDYIEFTRGGKPVATYSRQTTPEDMRLEWHDGWIIRFCPSDYSILEGDPVDYELVVLRMDNETPIINEKGSVTIHG